MERRPCGSNRDSISRRISCRNEEELETSNKGDGRSTEEVQKVMKKQFDKKRQNPQGLKVGDNMWLENKNIHSNRPSKKLDNKRYKPFRISKNIDSGAFQLELPEE